MANEFCHKHASVDKKVIIAVKALRKLTVEEMTEIVKAKKHGLDSKFYSDEYVYMVDKDGKDARFRGFNNNINTGINAPYKVCTVHNEHTWSNVGGSTMPETTPSTGG